MMYAVSATVNRHDKDGVVTIQVPTFYLDANVQGIVNKEHAKIIAGEIINPAKNPNLTVHLSVIAV